MRMAIGSGTDELKTLACTERYGNCTDFHALFIVYPHVEVAGKLWKGSIQKSFRYEEISAQASSASSMK
jgi:hypothetical protein